MRAEQQITVSAVAIGAEANIPLLKRITQYGGGFFHHIYDPTSLPQIVLQRVQEKQKDEPPPPERDFTPVQERGSDLLAGFSGKAYPPLRGFIETELKRGAHLDLFIPSEDTKSSTTCVMEVWPWQNRCIDNRSRRPMEPGMDSMGKPAGLLGKDPGVDSADQRYAHTSPRNEGQLSRFSAGFRSLYI